MRVSFILTSDLLWKDGLSNGHSFDCSALERQKTEWFCYFKEIMKFLSKMEGIGLLDTVCDFCLAENATLSNCRDKHLPLKIKHILGEEWFFASCRRCFFGTKYSNEIMLKISFLTNLLKLQLLTCPKLVMFSDRQELCDSSFHWLDPIKTLISGSVESLSTRFH